ncbi:WAT1-related protein At1g43650-like isoform X2 [Momordica charantia]|uniref:WAT1-related protein n=1 Tax=Momordica charantia TaxID=3673 RepID=A0A6J1CI51_MOMCH|nr:WAT1-related protein At1g43650-like isoform X2 [Momordica charantia]
MGVIVNNKLLHHNLFNASRPVLAMLLVQLFATGMQLLSKLILNQGTFIFALMAYRHVVAALCVAPFAFFFDRSHANKFSWQVLFWLFLSAFTGITAAMGMYYYGLRDTTATYATNFLNLIPVVTFVISSVLGMEKVSVRRRAGKVKIVGAILCVGGALITVFYKGKGFHIGHHAIAGHRDVAAPAVIFNEIEADAEAHWGRGTLLLLGSCFCYAAWFVVQVKLLKLFPSKYLATMLTCVIACIQSTALGLCLDRNKAAWTLGWDLQLLTILYSGALATAATFCLMTWAISIQGPTFPPMFNPVTLILVAISEGIILGEEIRVGNIVGTAVMVAGLYCFLWGKTKEMKKSSHLPRAAAGAVEAATATSEPAPLQSAAVVPSGSPTTNTVSVDVLEEAGSGCSTRNP